MSSELQRQVSSIRKQHLAVVPLQQGRPSLFLTASEAAAVDVSTIYEAASSALVTLQQYDGRFETYHQSLLHPSSVDLQRETKTAAENKALDVEIVELLKLLSLYAVEPSAHLVLEYLIRRYRIHEMNSNELLQYMLVAHDTKIYARIVQLCKLEDTVWSFMQGVKTSGVPLPRAILVQRALKDASLLETLTQYVQSALDSAVQQSKSAYPSSTHSLQGANKILSFYTAVVLEMSEERPFDDVRIRTVYLFLIEGLKNNHKAPQRHSTDASVDVDVLDQWRRACCMILVQLSLRTPLAKPLVKNLSSALSESFKRSVAASTSSSALVETASTMTVLALQQKLRVGSKFLQNILSSKTKSSKGETVFGSLLNVINGLQGTYNVLPFVSGLSSALTSELLQSGKVNVKPTEEAIASPGVLANAICLLLASGLADSATVRAVLSSLLSSVKKHKSTLGSSEDFRAGLKEVVQCVAQRFAVEFETTVQEVLKPSATGEVESGAEALTKFLADVFAAAEHRHNLVSAQGNGGGLLLSLSSAIAPIRAQALVEFASTVSVNAASTADVIGLAQAVSQNLQDPIPEVATAGWTTQVLHRVLPHLSGTELLEIFQTALGFWSASTSRSPEAAGKLVSAIFTVLEDATVLKALLAVSEPVNAGAQWVFQVAVPVALGSFALQHAASADSWEALSASAARVLRAASSLHSILAPFSALPAKTASHESRVASVTSAVASAKFWQTAGAVELISAVSSRLFTALSDDANSVYIVTKLVSVLLASASELAKAGKKVQNELAASLQLVAPLVLLSLDQVNSVNATAQEEILSNFDAFVAAAADSVPAAANQKALAEKVADLSGAVLFKHLGLRAVVKVLSSASPLVVKRLGATLQAFSTGNTWELLLRVVLTADQTRSNSVPAHSNIAQVALEAADSDLDALTVRVDTFTRSAALRALAAGVTSITSAKKVGAAESVLLVLLLPVVVKLCSDADAEQRALGLLLANRLSTLNGSLTLESKHFTAEAAAKAIRSVTAVVAARSAIIAVEPYAVGAALASEIFEAASDKDSVVPTLFSIAAEFGWSNPSFASALVSAGKGARLESTWATVKSLLEFATGEVSGHSELAEALVGGVKLGYTAVSAKLQAEVVAWVTSGITKTASSAAAVRVKQLTMGLIEEGLFADAAAEVRTQLYEALLQEQLERPGQKVIISALQNIQVELSLPAKILTEQLEAFSALYQQHLASVASGASEGAMEVDGEEDSLLSGLSAPLQRILSLLEAIGGVLGASTEEKDSALLGSVSVGLFDLLTILNEPSLQTVMLVDYCKALLMETVHTTLSIAGTSVFAFAAEEPKKTTTPKKSKAAKTDSSSAYGKARVEADIRLLLNCITSTKAIQVQSAALKLLKVLLNLNPATVMPSMQALGELLATSSANMQVGKEGLIEQILKTFVSFLPASNAAETDETALMPQYMLQSLCEYFYTMPHHRRSALLKMALSTMKSSATLAVAVNILLVHSFAAHETDSQSSGVIAAAEESVPDVMILLSKSASRRAHREMKSSVPEELFNLATEVLLARAPAVQVSVVISLLNSAHRLLELAISDTTAVESTAEGRDVLDINSTVEYCSTLLRTNAKTLTSSAPAPGVGDRRGHAATIAVLHLELIIEILENKTFHQMLANVIDAQAAQGYESGVQEYFMAFADSVLQLLAMTSAAEQGLGMTQRQKQPLNLRIEGALLKLAPQALGKHVSLWCYEALHTMQKLMDGPSFVAIIQELINHEQLEVRQKALVILGERLETMGGAKLKNDSEIDLYLDLNTHLREVVQSFLPRLQASAAGNAAEDFHTHSGLAQSALMCIDVLARFLGKRLDWSSILTETLNEVVELCTLLVSLTGPETASTESSNGKKKSKKTVSASSPALQGEYLKLLGSASLCTATLSSVLGAPALEQLPTIMSHNLSSLEHIGALVVAGPASTEVDEEVSEEAHSLWRTRVLLVRSVISAVGIMVAQLSNFAHPYIPRILSATLILEGLSAEYPESAVLREDVDRCLSTIALKIPTRLSVPLLLQSAPTLLGAGHHAACRFADLMAEVWQQLDRATVVAHLGPLSTLATLLLDYRRVFGDQSAAAAEVDAASADAVVELCLKLTESELKSFLSRLAEWRDVKFKTKKDSNGELLSEDADWRKYARAVSYFSLTDVLMTKLKSLFIPIMGTLWGSAIDLLTAFAAVASKSGKTVAAEGEKKEKKRKQAEDESPALSPVVVETELLVKYILSSVRECCVQDTNGEFVDESRFEKMMPAVANLIPLLRAFESEAAYLTYQEDYVGACLAALTVAVGSDRLWKPLNNKVLLLTRDNRKAVRLASVKIIHRLFTEAADEYLTLLPECLPFLSELMEDSSRDVVAGASEAIKFIEELSGEKLDSYLQ